MSTIHEAAAAKKNHYYFHPTRETVVARNAMFAAAFYATHIGLAKYTFESYFDPETGIVGLIGGGPAYYASGKIEICEEPNTPGPQEPEGTFRLISGGHSVPPIYFIELMYRATHDWAYEPGDEVSNLHDDILQPLKDDFHLLSPEQLKMLAHVIVERRHDYGDIWPTLEYIINNHYDRYMEHMHEIINLRIWDFEEELDDLLRPSRHMDGCC